MTRARALVLVLVLACLGLPACGRSTREPPPPAAESVRDGKVVLGSPRLTAGIPGEGPLTIAQIRAWLAEKENHRELEFALPLGLADAEPLIHIPADNPLTRAKIELGRQLFFDRRLSGLETFSCADCHRPEQSYSAHQVMPEVHRNTSAAFNRLFGQYQFWDGKAASLELQPVVPISNPFEMNSSPQQTAEQVRAIPGYRMQFEAIFGEVTFENICRALACFQRALVAGGAPWDYHRLLQQFEGRPDAELSARERALRDQLRAAAAEHPMSEAALRGERLFFDDAIGCAACHDGPHLSDEEFHNVGVGMDAAAADLGRYQLTGRDEDRGAFKTPTLRNVAQTAPYMHNGQLETLQDAVAWFARGGRPNKHLDPLIKPLPLSVQDQRDLVAFLKSLTSPLPEVETGRLPP